MKSLSISLIATASLFAPLVSSAAIVVSTFEEQALANKLSGFNVYRGEDGAASTFRSGNVEFANDGVFFGGTSWSGVGISRKTVRTAANFWEQGDDLISRPATGSNSATWGVVFDRGVMTADAGYTFTSFDVANTLWADQSMTLGDAFVGPPLGKGGGTGSFAGQDDFFVVQFTNTSSNAMLEFSLADFRGSNSFIRDDWSEFDVSSLDASQIAITLLGSRETADGQGGFFQNIPSYAAIDNIRVTSVPEPSLFGLSLTTLFLAGRRSRRGRPTPLSNP